MAIFRANSAIEAYRAWARTAADLSYLSGRGKNQLATEFISREILKQLELGEKDILVDIGCGDGTLLSLAVQQQATEEMGAAVGVLPTVEEVDRLNAFLIESNLTGRIRVIKGLAQKIPLPDEFADVAVANGVFLLLPDEASVESALQEMYRITKPGGKIFIGELPCLDESRAALNEPTDRTNSSRFGVLSRVYFMLKKYGLRGLIERLKKSIILRLSKKITVVPPTGILDGSSFVRRKVERSEFLAAQVLATPAD